MSFEKPPVGSDGAQSEASGEPEAPLSPTEHSSGLLGRLRDHVLTWPGRYVEMRVDARRRD